MALSQQQKQQISEQQNQKNTTKRVDGPSTLLGWSLDAPWTVGQAECAGPAEGGGGKLPKGNCKEFVQKVCMHLIPHAVKPSCGRYGGFN